MLPSNIKTYRELCASLAAFNAERFYTDDYAHPTRADNFLQSTGLMEYWLARHFRTLYEDFGSRLPRPTFPLVRNVVSSKAVAYKENVYFWAIDPKTGRRITPDEDPRADRITEYAERDGLLRALRGHEENSVLYQTAGLRPSLVEGELAFQTLSPMALDIVPWAGDPSDPSRARQILVPATGETYVPGARTDELRWAYERLPGGRGVYCQLVDPDGKPVIVGDRPVVPEEADANGRMPGPDHPVVVWKERESPGPYAPPPMSLYYAQVDLLLELASATVAVRLGGHGTLAVGKRTPSAPEWMRTAGGNPLEDGEDPKEDTPIKVPTGVQSVLQLPDDWTANLLQPAVDPEKYARWIQAKIRLSYMAEDMVPSAANITDPQPSNVSGKARMLEQAPRILSKSRRESRLAEQTVAVLRVWRHYHNLVCQPEDRIPEWWDFQVQFSEIFSPDVLADQTTVQAYQGASDLGLLDLIQLRQQIDGTTYTEARDSFWRSQGTRKQSQEPLPETPVSAG